MSLLLLPSSCCPYLYLLIMSVALSTTTRSIALISSRMICPISPSPSSIISNRCNLLSRRNLSSNGSSSASTIVQNLAIFAVAGGLGYGAVTFFNSSNGGNIDEPVQPSAPVTSRVYFDINAQNNQPLGRIVIGLYGSTVPKTVQNFETLCKGTKANGRQIG